MRLDHAIVLVKDLEKAVQNYTKQGFTVSRGGSLGGATNAIIPFSDGTYLELMSVNKALAALCRASKRLGFFKHILAGRSPMEQRFMRHFTKGKGLIDFAVLSDSIEEDIAKAKERGIVLEGPISGSRTQPDGSKLQFLWGIPPIHLPFLIMDETPREMRIPGGSAMEHANGVEGISRIEIVVDDLKTATDDYTALLGVEAEPVDTQAADVKLGSSTVRLSRAVPGGRGKVGLHSLQLRTKNGSFAGRLDSSVVHTQMELITEAYT